MDINTDMGKSTTKTVIEYQACSTTTFLKGQVSTPPQKFTLNTKIGEYFYKDGRIFKGKFEGNRRNGEGLYTFPDGRQYQGMYQMNFRHGDGILRLKDGSTLKGKWEVGKLVSFSIFFKISVTNCE
jgi:hypothetical protein